MLEVSAALGVAAVAIDFNRTSLSFARGAAILTIRLWGTTTRGVFASLSLVSHEFLLRLIVGVPVALWGSVRLAHSTAMRAGS